MNASRFLNLAAILSLDLESQYRRDCRSGGFRGRALILSFFFYSSVIICARLNSSVIICNCLRSFALIYAFCTHFTDLHSSVIICAHLCHLYRFSLVCSHLSQSSAPVCAHLHSSVIIYARLHSYH